MVIRPELSTSGTLDVVTLPEELWDSASLLKHTGEKESRASLRLVGY